MGRDHAQTGQMSLNEARIRVMAMVAEHCHDDSCPIQSVLDQCVSDAVAGRWDSRVKSFVPLLAFREVQECIRRGYCPEQTTS